MKKLLLRLALIAAVTYLSLFGLTACVQRKLLYFPSHEAAPLQYSRHQLVPWMKDGHLLGYSREVAGAGRVWLLLHGNAGQAWHRSFALDCFAYNDSVYIMEYPGYGTRPGKPSRKVFDAAAEEAYQYLRATHPGAKVCVLGESLGSGPACHLAKQPAPPDRIVLAVPFDRIVDVAQEKISFLPVRWVMLDRWDNIESLRGYKGPVEIHGATRDIVIPVAHARALAAAHPGSVYKEHDCEHGEWAVRSRVDLRAP